jgi:ATP-dependent DNA helicase RecQ
LFEETNKAKYLTDFKEYIFESSAEDFCDLQNADVVVSTIHKSKGMEFDDVYMLISEPRQLTDEVLRRYYVGITRAKQRLFIHTNGYLFDRSSIVQKSIEHTIYDMPNEIVLQLSHKDVNLGYFKYRKKEVLALRAGQKLRYENGYLFDIKTNKPVCQLSQKIMGELSTWNEKDYFVSDASIRFIVAWRPKDAPKEEKEHAVLLVDLTLNKQIGTGN